ncbi:MAG: AAA family ATPase [Pseudomonadota bacterium]
MELVVFIGLQGSGKSEFYATRFADSHLRVNRDMLRTRRRENAILSASLEVGQRVVIDNTNPTTADRAVYLRAAEEHHFQAVAYFFDVPFETCAARNYARPGKKCIPEKGLKATAKKLVAPTEFEGFCKIFYVDADGTSELRWSKHEV